MASVDPFLAIVLAIILGVLIIGNFYILVYWQHPEDKNESYVAKVTIVLGLALVEASVLLLPLDVSNNGGSPACADTTGYTSVCGGLDMKTFWEVFFVIVFTFVVFICPFSIFYYEADDGNYGRLDKKVSMFNCTKFCSAFKTEFAVLLFSFGALIPMYFTIGYTDIPVREYTASFANLLTANVGMPIPPGSDADISLLMANVTSGFASSQVEHTTNTSVQLLVTFPTYIIALMGWVGWFLFCLFGGIGLAALPLDLIRDFIYRPKHLNAVETAERMRDLQKRTEELIDVAALLKKQRTEFYKDNAHSWREKRLRVATDRTEVNKITQMVYLLENDQEELRACQEVSKGYNPLIPFAKLFFGIIALLISLLWMIHIIVYMLVSPPADLFLNKYLAWFDSWFPLFSVLSYTMFAGYMLACCVKGCFKFGIRFFCLKIHPMRVGKTNVNAFLFNLGVLMLCCVPCVQFCVQAFGDYAVNTSIGNIFGAQIMYMQFFRYFYIRNVFIYIIIVTAGLSFPYLLVKRKDEPVSAAQLKKSLTQKSGRV